MAKVYSVKAGRRVVGMRRNSLGTRLRAGVTFGAKPVMVSTVEGPGVTVVDEGGLKAILDDSHLEAAEMTPAEARKAADEAAPVEAPAKVAAKRGRKPKAK